MTTSTFRKLTGFIFILTPLWLFVNFQVLSKVSGFPDIQFAGVETLLTKVHESGSTGIITWYVYLIPGALYMAAVVMFEKVLEPERILWLPVATVMGFIAWALQFLGAVRWIFVYPYLANVWFDPKSTATTKEIVTIVFNMINNYAGYGIGQTIGIHLTAVWILLAGIAILKSPMFKPWLGYIAIIIALGEFIGNLGPLGAVIPGVDIQKLFNISGLFWYVSYAWMAFLGILMIRARADVYDDLIPPGL
jgi:hypothetical protein